VEGAHQLVLGLHSIIVMDRKSNQQILISGVLVLAVQTAAFLAAGLPALEALAVVLEAGRLRALAPSLLPRLLGVLRGEHILAIEALAVAPARPTLREALAVVGLAAGLAAPALHLPLAPRLLPTEGQQIDDLVVG
jgi:hypothetical protein